jgi:NitT/TauT family transport system ATP-binding protein
MENIHKRFGKRPVIAGFNLTVRQGEILGMLGPSGVGKSTILRLVAGLETPDSGRIRVATSRIGFVFQEARLLPWDTVLSNVVLPLRAMGMSKPEALERARRFLRRMALSEFEESLPSQLSGGMRQRVALARAFAVAPDILLLDEPFTGLDKALKKSIRGLLETALDECGAAVVHVTHDPAELLDRTSRIVELKGAGSEVSETPYRVVTIEQGQEP